MLTTSTATIVPASLLVSQSQTPTSLSIELSNTTNTTETFTIEYSATRDPNLDPSTKTCNDAEADVDLDGDIDATTQACTCGDGYFYCPLTDTCLLDGETCGGYDKEIIAYENGLITYQISGSISNGSLTIEDILDA